MKEYQQRQEAVARYFQGEKVATIARSMNKSRKWLHHWISRYTEKEGIETWFENESRAPKKVHKTLPSEIEKQILSIRQELVKEKMSQIGAISIQYECQRRGINPLPEIWTINRVIAKHGLNKEVSSQKKISEYPELFCHTHQMDLVGPRYLKGDGRFYSINFIDTTTRSCFVKAIRTKSSVEIVPAIATFWQTHGFPDALQLDNELAFRGGNRYPRSFGSVVRFALSQGVCPVFIPVAEPWRNGIIEKFNHTYQNKFLNAYSFENFEGLVNQEKSFIDFHNKRHRYSSQGNKTPDEMKSLLLPATYYKGIEHLVSLDSRMKIKIPLEKGCVYYIRYIRSDLKLHLPNESFILIPELRYSYVVAEINIEIQTLIVRQNDEIKHVFPFTINAAY